MRQLAASSSLLHWFAEWSQKSRTASAKYQNPWTGLRAWQSSGRLHALAISCQADRNPRGRVEASDVLHSHVGERQGNGHDRFGHHRLEASSCWYKNPPSVRCFAPTPFLLPIPSTAVLLTGPGPRCVVLGPVTTDGMMSACVRWMLCTRYASSVVRVSQSR